MGAKKRGQILSALNWAKKEDADLRPQSRDTCPAAGKYAVTGAVARQTDPTDQEVVVYEFHIADLLS